MTATKHLPPHYVQSGVFDIHDMRLALLLNGAGILLLFVYGWLFMAAAAWLRRDFAMMSVGQFVAQLRWWELLLALLAVAVLHELAHGLFFWLFTRERPYFGIGPGYAYAAAPAWYFPRNQFFLIGLAPLLLLSGLGILLMPFVPRTAVAWLILFLTANAAGAVGDLYVCAWLLRLPPSALANDEGAVIKLYEPLTVSD